MSIQAKSERALCEITRSIRTRLQDVYGPASADSLFHAVERLIQRKRRTLSVSAGPRFSEKDALLITYGDTFLSPDRSPLSTLHTFLQEEAGSLFSFLHLLPFYPWTSDDGFAVTDFRQVNPSLGTWQDIQALGKEWKLVFDGVVNHVSSDSLYMKAYQHGDPDAEDFFIALPPETDTRSVLRTRTLPLLHEYQTTQGPKWLWTTFGPDQIDLNFKNPKVFLEIIDVLLFYVEQGCRMIRLDAIPYLWKELGTSCAHLPQTHQLIKLFRDILDWVSPDILLLAEINAPWPDNVAYLGDGGDEAQLIYNFTLSPLILHALVCEDASNLTQWASRLPPLPAGTTLLNITASHDGIGIRPTEGVLPEEARRCLTELAVRHQGAVSGKKNSDGTVCSYELNVSYFDALNDPAVQEPQEVQVRRFMLAQLITFAFRGMPGVYIQSLIGSRNNLAGVRKTGRARTINRRQFDLTEIQQELGTPGHLRQSVLSEYRRLLSLRRKEKAFHPDAPQAVLDLSPSVFALKRGGLPGGEEILALHNVTNRTVRVDLSRYLSGERYQDRLTGVSYARTDLCTMDLTPYQCAWLKKETLISA